MPHEHSNASRTMRNVMASLLPLPSTVVVDWRRLELSLLAAWPSERMHRLSLKELTSNAQILSTHVVHSHDVLSARSQSTVKMLELELPLDAKADDADTFVAIVSKAPPSALKSTWKVSSPGSGPDSNASSHSIRIVDERLYTPPLTGSVSVTLTVELSEARDPDADSAFERDAAELALESAESERDDR